MKTILPIVILTILISFHTFSQERKHTGVFPDKTTNERLREIHQPNINDFLGLDEIELLQLNSKNCNWQTALRNPQKEFYEEEIAI